MHDVRALVREKAQAAREAALLLQSATDASRTAGVRALADALLADQSRILAANARDVARAEKDGSAGPLLARLKLDAAKFALVVEGVRQVARLEDPVGRTLRATQLDDGLRLFQVTVPLGVIACVFESRPDAGIQIAALTLRSGNAVLLKGGKEAEETNAVIVDVLRGALASVGLPEDAIGRLEGRAEMGALLAHDDLVDLMIPRGGTSFVRYVMDNTRIPVLGHAAGVCHVYADATADVDMLLPLAVDAKTDYPSACNAAECFLVHASAAARVIPPLVEALTKAGVQVRASPRALAHAGGLATAATAADWGSEHGDMVVSLDVVDDLTAAIKFINRHGSKHTDVIVTRDMGAAKVFVSSVDSAGVFVNASTRFADGYRYGLGAEVGISTSKIHARGPVGLDGLTTTKWVLLGHGHIASRYQGATPRPFEHAKLDVGLEDAWSE